MPALHEFRQYLAAVGYDEAGVAAALGHASYDSLLGSGRPAVVDTDASGAMSVLVRLLTTGSSVPTDEVAAVLPRGLPDRLAACGLLESAVGRTRGLVRVLPLDGLLVAADRAVDDTGAIRRDHVMAVAMSTKGVADVTVRRPVETALDLGTGSGALALLAARHARTVVGVDTNARALEFALFNAVLNEVHNVEFRLGDGFGPVAGERFDLVVSNPPFVVTPEPRYAFRDSGRPGDAFVEHLVRAAPAHLRPGGLLQMIGGWVNVEGVPAADRLREWGRGSGCGMWVVRTHSQAPREYAEMWSYDDAGTERAALVDEWERWLVETGVESVSDGFLFLRRGAAEWFRLDDLPKAFLPPAGQSVARVLDAGDLLARLPGPRALLDVALRPAPGAVLEAAAGGSGWQGGSLRLTSGFAFTARMEPPLLRLVAACDGSRRLRDLLSETVVQRGGTVDAVADAACTAMRALVERGLLVPVGLR